VGAESNLLVLKQELPQEEASAYKLINHFLGAAIQSARLQYNSRGARPRWRARRTARGAGVRHHSGDGGARNAVDAEAGAEPARRRQAREDG
jgi:hypothetical protein